MSEERTEKATPKKLKDSRKEGQVARTPEFGAWLGMLVFALVLEWVVVRGVDQVQALLVRSLAAIEDPSVSSATILLRDGTELALLLSAGLGLGVLVFGVVSAIAQGGFFVATKALKPKWSRLNPLQGAKRIFGPQALWEGAKILLKSSVVGAFVWLSVRDMMPLVGGLVPVSSMLEVVASGATTLLRNVALAGLVAAGADYAMMRRRTGKQVRMTKKEVRDEHKQSEGDPLIKSAIRARQLAAARSRMMVDVAKADVVLVNPTHVAVALSYQPEKGTPRVVAKGAGAVASRIRAVAEENRVAMVEDVPLARALHAACAVGQEIPPQLYQAVAQVLAFVLSRRAMGTVAGRYRTPREDPSLPEVPRRGQQGRRTSAKPLAGNPSGPLPAGR